jgi:hypothetical protein
MNNLLRDTAYRKTGRLLKAELFDWLEKTGVFQIPLKRAAPIKGDNLYRGTY